MTRPYRTIRPMFQRDRWRIFPGDSVYVNHGPCKGQSGKVLEVLKDKRLPQVLVEGVNLRKKKVYEGNDEHSFYVVTVEAPLHYCQVNLLMPPNTNVSDTTVNLEQAYNPSKRWVRAKFRYLPDGTRVRIGKGPNADPNVVIPIPEQPNPAAGYTGVGFAKDTRVEEVIKTTRRVSSAASTEQAADGLQPSHSHAKQHTDPDFSHWKARMRSLVASQQQQARSHTQTAHYSTDANTGWYLSLLAEFGVSQQRRPTGLLLGGAAGFACSAWGLRT